MEFTAFSDKLASLDAEIAKTEGFLDQLRKERISLLHNYNISHSPLLRLPTEVTTKIMLECCQSDTNDDDDDDEPEMLDPLFLGSICPMWRDIAWETQNLWRTVNLTLSRNRYHNQVRLLNEWLPRAGEGPLHIRVMAKTSEQDWTEPPFPHEVLRTFASYSRLWARVTLFIPYACWMDIGLVSGNLPLLKSLSISFTDSLYHDNCVIGVFHDTPLLEELSLRDIFLKDFISGCWNQLQHLTLKSYCADECLEALRRTPNLISLKFQDINPPDEFPIPYDEIIHLKCLDSAVFIFDIISKFAGDFLNCMAAPSLRQLDITLREDSEDIPFSSIRTLMSRCSSSLTHLRLEGTIDKSEDVIHCLRDAPLLRSLVLFFANEPEGVENQTIGLLGSALYSGDFLNELEQLIFTAHFDTIPSKFVRMLGNRWAVTQIRNDATADNNAKAFPPLSQLRKAHIEAIFSSEVHLSEEAHVHLELLLNDGMDICLRTPHGIIFPIQK
ncbi:hypothetical protein BDQ12DRAFT_723221 [Crucibulum laeve]|uniref:F-box domain-containing protein n=1 Tax=Crucibulum laeve TaxID=68775 RepID=A0A5C3MB19_9AGAR|nr:hypothetical protein BDQ12DRAFT_723221 [Crucibulum laeve]